MISCVGSLNLGVQPCDWNENDRLKKELVAARAQRQSAAVFEKDVPTSAPWPHRSMHGRQRAQQRTQIDETD